MLDSRASISLSFWGIGARIVMLFEDFYAYLLGVLHPQMSRFLWNNDVRNFSSAAFRSALDYSSACNFWRVAAQPKRPISKQIRPVDRETLKRPVGRIWEGELPRSNQHCTGENVPSRSNSPKFQSAEPAATSPARFIRGQLIWFPSTRTRLNLYHPQTQEILKVRPIHGGGGKFLSRLRPGSVGRNARSD